LNSTDVESFSFMTFSGEESDRFVKFARIVKETGQLPYVRVFGREPITSMDVVFEGFVKEVVYEGYIRYLVVETNDGKIYNVGGSNATKSIAAEKVVFQELPEELRPHQISQNEIDLLLQEIQCNQEKRAQSIARLKRGLPFLGDKEKTKIVNFLKDYLRSGDAESRREIAEFLALVATPDILDHMLVLLKDNDPRVRVEVALRFRALEKLIKNSGEKVYDKCVGALIQALHDPDRDVRAYVSEDLGYMFNADAISALLISLNDEDDHVRWASAIALGRIGHPRVVPHLVRKITTDQFDRVRQSALLGLGRIGRAAYDECPEMLEALVKTLESGSDVAKSYAAFALGQLGDIATNYIGKLAEALSSANVVDIRSNAALALGKLVDEITDDQREKIKQRLSEPLDSFLQGEAISPYYFWFLEYGGELASSLELHSIASKFYETLGKVSPSWQKTYFEALSKYEQAEEYCEKGEIEGAISLLDTALQELRGCKGYPVDAQEGMRFRTLMVEARKNIVEGIIDWSKAIADEYSEAQRKFRAAYKVYATFSVPPTGPLQEKKRLTEREVNFIATLKYMAWFGERFIEIELATIAGDTTKAKNLLSNIEVDTDRLSERISSSSTAYFQLFVQNIHMKISDLISNIRSEKDELSTIKAIRQGIDSVRQLYCSTSFPLPARMCPVVGLGVAKIGVRVTGAFGGDGSSSSGPMFFTCDAKLVITVDIFVEKRTRSGDRLIFCYLDTEGRTVEADIPVFEGSYMLQLDYGIIQKSFEPLPYRMWLRFQGSDCEQMADQKTLWIQTYDPRIEFLFPLIKDSESEVEESRVITLAAVQLLCCPSESPADHFRYFYDEDLLSRGVLVFKRSIQEEIRKKFECILSNIKTKHSETQIVVFPELSAPFSLHQEFEDWAKKHEFYIIVGFEHIRNPYTHKWENTLHAFSPTGEGWQQPKNSASSFKIGERLIRESILDQPRPWILNRGKTRFGEIMILSGSEVTTINSASEVTKAVTGLAESDILILPSILPSGIDFHNWVEFNLKQLYRCIVFANHAEFGYSAILSPKLDMIREVENARSKKSDEDLAGNVITNGITPPILLPGKEGYVIRSIDIFKIRHIRQTKAEDKEYLKPG